MVTEDGEGRTKFYGQLLLVKVRPQGVRYRKYGTGTEMYDSLMLSEEFGHMDEDPILDVSDKAAGLNQDFRLPYITARTARGSGAGGGYASVGLWGFWRGISWVVKSGS